MPLAEKHVLQSGEDFGSLTVRCRIKARIVDSVDEHNIFRLSRQADYRQSKAGLVSISIPLASHSTCRSTKIALPGQGSAGSEDLMGFIP
jgi:hypothetical protein